MVTLLFPTSFRRFRQNVVILLVAIPPTNVEAANPSFGFRLRFRIPGETVRKEMD